MKPTISKEIFATHQTALMAFADTIVQAPATGLFNTPVKPDGEQIVTGEALTALKQGIIIGENPEQFVVAMIEDIKARNDLQAAYNSHNPNFSKWHDDVKQLGDCIDSLGQQYELCISTADKLRKLEPFEQMNSFEEVDQAARISSSLDELVISLGNGLKSTKALIVDTLLPVNISVEPMLLVDSVSDYVLTYVSVTPELHAQKSRLTAERKAEAA